MSNYLVSNTAKIEGFEFSSDHELTDRTKWSNVLDAAQAAIDHLNHDCVPLVALIVKTEHDRPEFDTPQTRVLVFTTKNDEGMVVTWQVVAI